jgi:Dihaem cytochrome c
VIVVRFRSQNRRTRFRIPDLRQQPKIWGLLLLFLWSILLGWGLAVAADRSVPFAQAPVSVTAEPIGTVDAVPPGLQLPQQLYLQRCGSCHFGIPPAVMPTESWRAILLDPNHYGLQLKVPPQPDLSLIWKYLSTHSRRLNPDETVPFKIGRSRYFKILHPRVDIPQPVALSTCVSCHPGLPKNDFRSLSPEWENSP